MTLRPLVLALALTLSLAGCASGPALSDTPQAAVNQQAKATRLNALYDQYWEEVLKLNPVQATFQGDNRYNDQLPDFGSAAFRQQQHDFTTR
ncbi:MAG TPA: DUF885 domain-containing protein, partial [Lysobacter sp.]